MSESQKQAELLLECIRNDRTPWSDATKTNVEEFLKAFVAGQAEQSESDDDLAEAQPGEITRDMILLACVQLYGDEWRDGSPGTVNGRYESAQEFLEKLMPMMVPTVQSKGDPMDICAKCGCRRVQMIHALGYSCEFEPTIQAKGHIIPMGKLVPIDRCGHCGHQHGEGEVHAATRGPDGSPASFCDCMTIGDNPGGPN
jgi:hypothetical protein